MLGVALAASGLVLAPLSFNNPGFAEGESLLIRAERVIVRPGVELENQSILVQDGVIVAIGEGLAPPDGAREINGAVVCAGFVDPWSALGLDAGAARDSSASAATRSADGVDRWSHAHHLEDALRAGVTSLRVQGGGGAVISGYGSMMRVDPSLGGDDALLLDAANMGATIGLPRGGRTRDIFDRVSEVDRLIGQIESGRKYRESAVEYKYELEEWQKEIEEKEKELEKDFKKAKKDREKDKEKAEEKGKEFKEKKYKEDKKPRKPKYDEDSEAMARVADGEVPLVVQSHRYEELRSLLEKTESYDRLRVLVAGGTEALLHADELQARGVPVIVWPNPMGPARGDEYDGHELSLAASLDEAGVEVLIGSGGSDTSRELRFLAALAVSHGLDPDAALNAITLGAANAFDVGDRIGSVERGKDADLLVLDGDPLDTTARIRFVVSQGRVVVEH